MDLESGNFVEHTVKSVEIFKGKLLHVFQDHVKLPDGEESTREWIKHPGATAIVPLYENGDTMLIRQFRYPMKQIFLEVPAGKLDPNEEPLRTGQRELTEETGLKADNWTYIGNFYPGIGYSDEIIYIYAAETLTEAELNVDEDEFVEPVRLPFSEAVDMVHRGEITDGKTVISLLRTEQWLKSKKRL